MITMGTKNILVSATGKQMESNRWECAVCKEEFRMTSKFLDHMTATNHCILLCNICNKTFSNQKDLDEHYLSTHNEVINMYKCKKCDRKFSEKKQLEQHLQFHLVPVSPQPRETKNDLIHNSNDNVDYGILNTEDDFISYEERVISKFKQTRSGRIVKVKKRYEIEIPERDRKYDKKLEEVSDSEEFNSDTKSKAAYDVNPTTCNNKSRKELCVIAEKIPNSVYEKYMRNERIFINSALQNKNKSMREQLKQSQKLASKSNDLPIMKYSFPPAISKEHLNIMEDLHKIMSPIKNKRQATLCKEIKSGDINVVHDETVSNQSQCTSLNSRIDEGNSNQNNKLSTSPIVLNNASNCETFNKFDHSSKSSSMMTKHSQAGNVSELLKQNNKPNVSVGKPIISPPVPNILKKQTVPLVVEKKVLYIGREADIGKIQTAIMQMDSKPKVNEDTKYIAAERNKYVSPQNVSKMKSCVQSVNHGITKQVNPSNTLNSNSNRNEFYVNELSKQYPLHGKNGVIDKKSVNEFLIVKITPELMQEMEQKWSTGNGAYSGTNSLNVAKFNSINTKQNESMSKNTSISNKSETSKIVTGVKWENPKTILATKQNTPLSFKSCSGACSDTVTENVRTEKRKLTEENNLISNNSTDNNLLMNNSDERVVKMSKKLIDHYKAKLNEKESKKKKKYLLKKHMKHLQKYQNTTNATSITSLKTVYKEKDQCLKLKQFNQSVCSNEKSLISNNFNFDEHISLYLEVAKDVMKTNKMDIIDANSFHKNVECTSYEEGEEKTMQKISQLYLLFQKTLDEKEYLKHLNELDNLITPNISKKCSFIVDILLFCRLYVDNYDVKQRALSILNKIS